MKTLFQIFLNIFKKETHSPIKIGRWNINYSQKIIDRKMDLSNEDHCGPCGQYKINTFETKNKLKV
jgi:hypothetical protein